MDKGQIIEQGSHEELLKRKGKYWKLWEMQQGNFSVNSEENVIVEADVEENLDELVYT